jgi:uncharacterized cupin superfamily protein
VSGNEKPVAVFAAAVAPRVTRSNLPAIFHEKLSRRAKRALGDLFGLTVFGVNLTRLSPGGFSSLRHVHTRQDEFVYVLEGELTLITDDGEVQLRPGMCAGFKAGNGNAHHLVNRSAGDAVYLEIGDRSEGDEVTYPDEDLVAQKSMDKKRIFTRKNGTPY